MTESAFYDPSEMSGNITGVDSTPAPGAYLRDRNHIRSNTGRGHEPSHQ
jgi:hypothetical protein